MRTMTQFRLECPRSSVALNSFTTSLAAGFTRVFLLSIVRGVAEKQHRLPFYAAIESNRMMRIILLALMVVLPMLAARGPVYVMLWFDTEDYMEPSADDAALRIATELDKLGARATFKVVGEKARVLEQRGRRDVIRALARHDIGYHTNFHSVQPTPALYLRDMGWFDGAAEFRRREEPGVKDIRRIFGVNPSCYGQPGSSWGPQTYRALLEMGIPVYLDEGSQVGVDEQPFWFG